MRFCVLAAVLLCGCTAAFHLPVHLHPRGPMRAADLRTPSPMCCSADPDNTEMDAENVAISTALRTVSKDRGKGKGQGKKPAAKSRL